jgi:hypothetical protein
MLQRLNSAILQENFLDIVETILLCTYMLSGKAIPKTNPKATLDKHGCFIRSKVIGSQQVTATAIAVVAAVVER